ncbi:MAG TPA: gluconate 2-dehydrogenase subunit 3 family protein [Bryobacteraceae bacterium]|nr:gluconate 2-dehydrogenase subunit 3 family protein [Bryobacteraceae bacterium]
MKQRKQPGYYLGFSTLSQRAYWDAATRAEVEKRVYNVPEIRFFTDEELPLITAVCDRIVPQDDRLPERRIPVVNYIDERLFENRISGYRYEDMPPDREAHRLGLQAIDRTALEIHGRRFVELDVSKQELILKSIHDGEKLAAHDIWARMSVDRYWQLLVGDCVGAYYAHPWAWDEIGYGGPAYPRAYMRLENGLPEPWEVDEQRYDWTAPPDSISDVYEETGAGETSHHGQAGTH